MYVFEVVCSRTEAAPAGSAEVPRRRSCPTVGAWEARRASGSAAGGLMPTAPRGTTPAGDAEAGGRELRSASKAPDRHAAGRRRPQPSARGVRARPSRGPRRPQITTEDHRRGRSPVRGVIDVTPARPIDIPNAIEGSASHGALATVRPAITRRSTGSRSADQLPQGPTTNGTSAEARSRGRERALLRGRRPKKTATRPNRREGARPERVAGRRQAASAQPTFVFPFRPRIARASSGVAIS